MNDPELRDKVKVARKFIEARKAKGLCSYKLGECNNPTVGDSAYCQKHREELLGFLKIWGDIQ